MVMNVLGLLSALVFPAETRKGLWSFFLEEQSCSTGSSLTFSSIYGAHTRLNAGRINLDESGGVENKIENKTYRTALLCFLELIHPQKSIQKDETLRVIKASPINVIPNRFRPEFPIVLLTILPLTNALVLCWLLSDSSFSVSQLTAFTFLSVGGWYQASFISAVMTSQEKSGVVVTISNRKSFQIVGNPYLGWFLGVSVSFSEVDPEATPTPGDTGPLDY